MVESITIIQDNKENGCELLSIHNPLVFICEIDYINELPTYILASLFDETDSLLSTFRCLFKSQDVISNKASYYFVANDVLKAYMGDYSDFKSEYNTPDFCDNFTKGFKIIFSSADIDDEAIAVTEFIACCAARQYGESPCLEEIVNNSDMTYFGGVDNPVYIYVYNNDENNTISIDNNTGEAMLDYDDVIFLDFDDYVLKY